MNLKTTEEVRLGARRKPAVPPGVRLKPEELRRRMQTVGLTGGELARRANVAKATVFRALAGDRIYPSTTRAIAEALAKLDPIPGADGLIDYDGEERGDSRG